MRRRYCKEMLMLMFHGIFGDQILNQQKKTTNKLRVLNSAARIISNTCKFDRDSLISGEVSYTGWTLLTRFGSEPAFSVQVSAQHGCWIPVHSLPTGFWCSWSPPPAISWPRSPGLPSFQTGYIWRTCICLRWSTKLELTSCPPQRQ